MQDKFELEEMQKDLELLLQAQQPSLQLSQTKPPQHLQQTIVGQINYIERQPAPIQPQSRVDPVQAADEPPALEGPKPALPLDKNTTASLPQAAGGETPHLVPALGSAAQHSSPKVVRKVLTEPAFPDPAGPCAHQDLRDPAQDDLTGGGVSLFHPGCSRALTLAACPSESARPSATPSQVQEHGERWGEGKEANYGPLTLYGDCVCFSGKVTSPS